MNMLLRRLTRLCLARTALPMALLLTLLLAIPLTLLAGCDAADPGAANAANVAVALAAAKSDVCHYDADAGTYHLINVADASLPAHEAHGDASPGEEVPTMPGYEFDAACEPVEIPPACVVGEDVPGQEGYVYDAACEPVLATCPCSYEGLPDIGLSEIEELLFGGTEISRETDFQPGVGGANALATYGSPSGSGRCRSRIDFTIVEDEALSSIAEAEACRVALYALNDGICISSNNVDPTNNLCRETYFETFGE